MNLWNWWRGRARRESELEEEIQTHLRLATRDLIERGEKMAEAPFQARREFGNVMLIREVTRAQWAWEWLDQLGRDARYAVRALWRNPVFSVVTALSLALSIGSNTALFSLADSLLLRSLPVKEPDRLVRIQRVAANDSGLSKPTGIDGTTFDSLRALSGVFSDVIVFANLDRPLITIDGTREPSRVVEQVTTNFFRGLGVRPAIGQAANDGPAAVVSYRFWKTRFNGSPNALGRILNVNGKAYPIAGVAPRRFMGLSLDASTDVWLLSPGAASFVGSVIGRLQPGVEPGRAQAATDVLFQQLDQEPGSTLPGRKLGLTIRARVTTAGKGLSNLRDQYQWPLQALMVLVTLVLLITCTNIGNLLGIRNAGRMRELTVRAAMGARRSRLIAQLLTESAVLTIVGSALGLLAARWAVSAMLSMLPLTDIPEQLEFRLDARMLGFMATVSLVSALLFALAPAWRATRVDLTTGLKASAGISIARDTRRVGRWLMIGQIALSVVLLAGAGLFVRTLRNLMRTNPGFDTRNLLQVELDTAGSGYEQGQVGSLYKLLIEKLTAIPGVRSASSIHNPVMMGGIGIVTFTIGGTQRTVETAEIGPKFFETMHIPLLRGRFFTPEDEARSGRMTTDSGLIVEVPAVVVISESLAKEFFPGMDAIGRPLPDSLPHPPEIIGVVKDAKLSGLREDFAPTFYTPQWQEPERVSAILVRSAGNFSAVAGAVQQEVRRVNPRLLRSVSSMQEKIDRSIAPERMVAATSGFFGMLALALAGIGLFGVISFTVARRTHEFGIRIALGAGPWHVVRESLQETVLVFGLGLIVGCTATFVGARLASSMISGLLFGLNATNWTNIAGAALVMLGVAITACVIPAVTAARVDPVQAMRYE